MPEIRHSLRERLALRFVLLATVTIIILTIVAVLIAGAHMKQRILLQLSSESSSKEDLIEQRLQRDWEQVSLLSRRPDARQLIRGSAGLTNMLSSLQEEGIPMVGLATFNVQGNVIASVGTFADDNITNGVGGGTPLVNETGWYGHIVLAPVKDGNDRLLGFLGAQFDMRDSLAAILAVTEIGESAEVLIGKDEGGELVLLSHRYKSASQQRSIGALQQHIQRNDPLARAVLRQEGVIRARNYEGRDVFAAYRYLPRLGWGLALTIDVNEALIGMWAIGIGIGVVSLFLLGMTALLSVSFATRLSAPLQGMSAALKQLGPDHWDYVQTVHTGDELELADATISEMAFRLKELYDNLEAEVQERTTELREQFEIDKAILNSTLHGMVLVDPEGNVISVNPAAESMIGKDAGMCQGLPIFEVMRLYRKNHAIGVAKHPVLECLQSGQPVKPRADVHWSTQDPGGSLLPINLAVTPVFDGEKMLGAVAVFRDVTEERRVEELKSEFISLASHQLRTPLSVVKWYSELLGDADARDKQELRKQYVQEISKAGDRMSNLVDALLQAAQLESKGIMSEKKKVDMNLFVEDLGEELRSLAKGHKIYCSIEVPEEKIILNTDPILLHIVVQNLFSNSVKYTAEGGSVGITLHKDNDVVEIAVKDTGVGIPQSASKRIFQRLFRAENAKNMETDGSGLGLYISNMIMDILGGTIDFTSKEGTGTTFTVQIPEIQKD